MSVRINHKCCANCELWQGARDHDSFKTSVQVTNGAVKGRCMDRHQDTNADYGACTRYKKWAVLK